jgi:hypothetical protein
MQIRGAYWRLAAMLFVAWYVMTLSHELGHIVGGWLCGAELLEADLTPWRLPYSIFSVNPFPLFTLWCGPWCGVVVPVVAALTVRGHNAAFVAYFCTLANGLYLAAGWLAADRYLDSTMLLEAGASQLSLGTFCLLTIPVGYVGLRSSIRRMLQGDADEPNSSN